MTDCLFCKIVKKGIASDVVSENELVLAIKDISPQAPVHLLLIPKRHYATLNDIPELELSVVTEVFRMARRLARSMGIAQTGFRTVVNTNRQGGQSVFHVHFHLLGGRQLGGSMVG